MNKVINGGTGTYTHNVSNAGVDVMPIITPSGLKVTYNNPNPDGVLADELIKILARGMYNKILKDREEKIDKEIQDIEGNKTNDNLLNKKEVV